MSAAKQKITVTFHRDGTLQITVNDGGRPADMSDPRNIANVAGTLAKTSVEMMKEFNRLTTKDNESKTSEKTVSQAVAQTPGVLV